MAALGNRSKLPTIADVGTLGKNGTVPDPALSPRIMLATSMHAQPGVYALLLGSGVSTGAGVPTGWGVVRELIRRVAVAAQPGDDGSLTLAESDPELWWTEHGHGELGYASLLEALAPTAAARQGLLREFFEPTDEEREEGLKVPSFAHRAIAQLVKAGLVRVVLTTNFDRLMEQALEAAGVAPQVIARPEAVHGMAPLVHSTATVIKLHGDYLDLGSRNTPTELGDYPSEWTNLLAQVFDEYGLIICGWSADWDTALVRALDVAPSRRYPLYWDSRSSKGDVAQGIVANRHGQILPAAGADELFTGLQDSVEALTRLTQPPLTTAMALARLKRYLPDPVHRIDLNDLVMDATQKVAVEIATQATSGAVDGAIAEAMWAKHLAAVDPLVQLLVTGVWHDPEGAHDQLWVDSIQRLVDAGTVPLQQWTEGLDEARLWPALIAVTAMGVAAVRRGREDLVIAIATRISGRGRSGTDRPAPAGQLLHPDRLLQKAWVDRMPRWNGVAGWLYPSSHLLKADIRAFFVDLIPLENDFVQTFHGYEYRLGLIQERQQDADAAYRALSGEYVGERGWSRDDRDVPVAESAFRSDLHRQPNSRWVDLLGGDLDSALVSHRDVLVHYRGRW